MWIRKSKKFYTNVLLENTWKVATDIDKWPTWHDDLDDCKLVGEFKEGSHFFLKPKGMKAFKITLTEINEKRDFTDCTPFFGAKMFDTHSFEKKDGGVVLSNEVRVTGPLKWLWVFLVARKVAGSSISEMDALINLVRKNAEKHRKPSFQC